MDIDDHLVARIERIKSEQLKCNIPFDNQTMDHVGALIGAYLELSMENYRQRYADKYDKLDILPNVSDDSKSKLQFLESIYRRSRATTPFAFFVMTTKRLLDDVNVLKKDRNRGDNSRKRSRSASSVDTVNDSVGGKNIATRNLVDDIRQSSCSLRLSYSSTGSSSKESQTSSFLTSSDLHDADLDIMLPSKSMDISVAIRRNEKKPRKLLSSIVRGQEISSPIEEVAQEDIQERGIWPAYWAEDNDVNFCRMKGTTDSMGIVIKENIKVHGDRRVSLLEKDQSPINTSLESANSESAFKSAEMINLDRTLFGELTGNCSNTNTSGGTTASRP